MAEPITSVLGTVAIKHCGEYDATMHYEKLNVVTYNGSSYCAKDNTVGNLPTNTTYWDLMAEKGDKGETGEEGYTPVKGTDYYTDADKAELESTLASDVSDEVTEQLSDLASATPLVASSTAGMTDTTRIYVNTTDGHWYWYNGSAWTDGGVYQASEIGDREVIFDNLEKTVQDSLKGLYNDSNVYSYDAKYIDANGGIHDHSNRYDFLWDVDVNENEVYYVYRKYDKNNLPLASYPTYVIKDSSNNILEKEFVTESDIINTYLTQIIRIPAGGKKLYINSTYGYYNSSDNTENRPKGYILKLQGYGVNEKVTYNNFDDVLKNMFDIKYEPVTPSLSIPNSIYQYEKPVNLNNWTTYIYDVTPGENFKIEGLRNFGTYPLLSFGTKDVTLTYTFNDVEYSTPSPIEKFNDASTISTFTIPDYCNKIMVSASNSNTNYKIFKQSGIKINPDNVDIDLAGLVDNPLNNKTLCFTGDSISAASTAGVKGFVQIMHENNPSANFYNYAHDGYTIGKIQDSLYSIQNTLPTMLEDHPDADYIILQGGANDIWQSENIPKGSMSNSFDINDFDRSTFAGGLEWMICYCLTNFPAKKVGFIVTHQIRWLPLESEYMELARNICKKWSIPYVDLFNEGDLNMNFPLHASSYSITKETAPNGDGCHPNLAGYQIITPKIENWLKYKI